jgi:hypothetical protein
MPNAVAASAAPLAERERNRLLRRADWRFLLPDPRPARVLCLGSTALRDACAAIGAEVDTIPDDGFYDAAALSEADDRAIAAAFAAVRPGGGVYGEWAAAAVSDVRRRLVAAGFAEVACYRPWPEPPATEIWVPSDAPWAFDYYESVDRHVYSGVRHRLGTRIRRALARRRLARVGGSLVAAVARKPGGEGEAPALVDTARTEAHIADESRLTVALLTGGPRAISKVVAVGFAGGAREPSLVVKWPRVPESEAGLAREAAALAASHERGPAQGVPRLLARSGDGGSLGIAETAARGVPMFTRITRDNVESLTRLGASWLASFGVRERRPPDRDALRELVAGELRRFTETFGAVVDRTLVDETAKLCDTLEVPFVIEHRDFGPWNLFLDDTKGLTALDWESSRVHGLPLLDLLYFMTYMAFFVEGAIVSRDFAKVYRATLDPRSAHGALRQELLEKHRELFGISSSAVRALRALCWIGHAESEFQHFSADAGGVPSPEALRGSVFVQLWREEILSLR